MLLCLPLETNSGSINMYKKRLGNWDIRKNLKEPEVIVMLHAKGRRNAENKESEFFVRGFKIHPKRLQQYLRRNKTAKARYEDGELPDDAARAYIISRTPSPGPSSGPAPAGPLRDTQLLLRHAKNYIDSSFATEVWAPHSDSTCRSRRGHRGERLLVSAWARFDTVLQSMWRLEDIEIFKILDPAFRGIRQAIREETPQCFSFILSALLVLRRYRSLDTIDLSVITLNYICKTSGDIFGPHHPMARLWAAVAELIRWDESYWFEGAFNLFLRELEARLGKSNAILASIRADYFDALVCKRSTLEQEGFLRQALLESSARAEYWSSGATELKIRHHCTLRNLKCLEKNFDEAERLTMMPFCPSHLVQVWQTQSLGHIKRRAGDFEGARQLFQQAFESAEGRLSFEEEQWIQPVLLDLEDILRHLNKSSEADRFRDIRFDRVRQLVSPASEPVSYESAMPLPPDLGHEYGWQDDWQLETGSGQAGRRYDRLSLINNLEPLQDPKHGIVEKKMAEVAVITGCVDWDFAGGYWGC